MGRGRPPKSAEQKALEGNRGKGRRPAVSDMPLDGVPILPDGLDAVAAGHFERVAAELSSIKLAKQIDSEALSVLGSIWSDFWRADEMLRRAEEKGDWDERKLAISLKYRAYAAWSQLAAKFCLTPVDRLKLVAAGEAPKLDETEERFFRTVG